MELLCTLASSRAHGVLQLPGKSHDIYVGYVLAVDTLKQCRPANVNDISLRPTQVFLASGETGRNISTYTPPIFVRVAAIRIDSNG